MSPTGVLQIFKIGEGGRFDPPYSKGTPSIRLRLKQTEVEMVDINVLFDFSRQHCIAICACLVPANLLSTLQTMIMVGLHRPIGQVRLMITIATAYALLQLLHVYTWFAIGVVMAPTFILIFLSTVCLAINVGALLYSNARGYGQHTPILVALWHSPRGQRWREQIRLRWAAIGEAPHKSPTTWLQGRDS